MPFRASDGKFIKRTKEYKRASSVPDTRELLLEDPNLKDLKSCVYCYSLLTFLLISKIVIRSDTSRLF